MKEKSIKKALKLVFLLMLKREIIETIEEKYREERILDIILEGVQ